MPRRLPSTFSLLAATAALAAAAGSVQFTLAGFGFTTSSAHTRVEAAELDVDFSTSGSLAASALRPGARREQTVRVTNTGSTPVRVRFEAPAVTAGALAHALQVAVRACPPAGACTGAFVVPAGPLDALERTGAATLGVGESARFEVTLTFEPGDADPVAFDGASLPLSLRWSAEAVRA